MQTSKSVINITLTLYTVSWESTGIFAEAKQDVLVGWVGKNLNLASGRKDYHRARCKDERTELIMMAGGVRRYVAYKTSKQTYEINT